jgi:hypothetical protein
LSTLPVPLPDLGAPPPDLHGLRPEAGSPFAPTTAPPALPAPPVERLKPVPAPQPVWRAVFEADPVPGTIEMQPYPIQLEPPDMERVAQAMQSDVSLQERIRQEHRERKTPERVTFPESPILTTEAYAGRSWGSTKMVIEPNYVIYRRMFFQQNNFERYGWDLGPVTSVVSAATFLGDFLKLPYDVFTDPCRLMESNAGWCLPGDPVPLLLYPPEISLTGALMEAGAVLALVAVFP